MTDDTRPPLVGAVFVPAASWTEPYVAPRPKLADDVPQAWQVRIVATAALAGFVAQLLVVNQAVGINLVIWVALVLGSASLLRRPTARLDQLDLWLPAAALAFAAFPALRSDGALVAFDTLAAGSLTLASVVALGGIELSRRSWAGLVGVGSIALLLATTGAARLGAGTAPFRAMVRVRGESPLARVVRGLLLALPLLLVVAFLFSAADAVFATYLSWAADLPLAWDDVLARAFVLAIGGWLLAGTLVAAWMSRDAAPPVVDHAAHATSRRLGSVEAVVVLVALDAIFAIFVLFQVAYLFGGLDTLAVSGMTYSEYARRGFFELIAVAALAGAVVLGLDAVVERRSWTFRLSAALLAVLTGVVLFSAVARLSLYQAAYGWTELRFFALAGMAWLAIGVVATTAGVLRDRAVVVPRVMVFAGLAVALAVNAIGPQAFVTEQNLARAIDPRLVPADGHSGLDLDYLGTLAHDAVPLIVAALPQLPEAARASVEADLRARSRELAAEQRKVGWPSWNLGRERAIEALRVAGYAP